MTANPPYKTRELSPETWPAFERLFSQGGGWDFCGCMLFQGGDSPATLRNVVTTLEAILPNATKRSLAGQGHGAPAGVLAPILESFYGG